MGPIYYIGYIGQGLITSDTIKSLYFLNTQRDETHTSYHKFTLKQFCVTLNGKTDVKAKLPMSRISLGYIGKECLMTPNLHYFEWWLILEYISLTVLQKKL